MLLVRRRATTVLLGESERVTLRRSFLFFSSFLMLFSSSLYLAEVVAGRLVRAAGRAELLHDLGLGELDDRIDLELDVRARERLERLAPHDSAAEETQSSRNASSGRGRESEQTRCVVLCATAAVGRRDRRSPPRRRVTVVVRGRRASARQEERASVLCPPALARWIIGACGAW